MHVLLHSKRAWASSAPDPDGCTNELQSRDLPRAPQLLRGPKSHGRPLPRGHGNPIGSGHFPGELPRPHSLQIPAGSSFWDKGQVSAWGARFGSEARALDLAIRIRALLRTRLKSRQGTRHSQSLQGLAAEETCSPFSRHPSLQETSLPGSSLLDCY